MTKTIPKKNPSKTAAKATAKAKPKVKSKVKLPQKRKGSPQKNRSKTRSCGRFVLIAGVWSLFLGCLALLWFSYDLPSIDVLVAKTRAPSITLLSRDGQRLTTVGSYYDNPVATDQLPKHVIHAFLATEDRRFFDHFGIDVFGLVRAFIKNLMAGRVVQGGSTITQQLAKNFLLTHGLYTYQDRSVRRKIQEVVLSLWLEMTFTKHQILTIYLNRVYFGSGAFGLGAASQHYYRKTPKALTVYEAALLAGLLKAPSKYSPHVNEKASQKRTQVVLGALRDAAFITDDMYHRANSEKPTFKHRETAGAFARYFVDWVVETIPETVGTLQHDIIVTTTLDVGQQRTAEMVTQDAIAKVQKTYAVSQAALVAMTPTGAVRAMVGGVRYGNSQFNRATQAYRQTGSIFKLFVYLAALENGFHPLRKISDGPMTIGSWSPKNYGWRSRGDISFQDSFAYSVNTASVRLAKYAGHETIQSLCYALGLSVPQPRDLTMALGSGEASLLEMTGAFAHIANSGRNLEPYGILKIQTRFGESLYERVSHQVEQVLKPQTVSTMKTLLASVMNYGTGRKVALQGHPCYGKSGTTQDYHDAWFVGFTDDMVVGVWAGNDDNAPMNKVTGAKLPGAIWRAFMKRRL